MAGEHPVTVQRALGLARGAGGVDHHRRIVRPGRCGLEGTRPLRHQRVEAQGAGRRAVRRHDQPQRAELVADLAQLGKPGRIGDHRRRAAVGEPVAQRVDTEEICERHRDGAQLVDGKMAEQRLRRLRQQQCHPLAAGDPLRLQRIGEPGGRLVEPAIGPALDAAVLAKMQQRLALGRAGGKGAAGDVGDVVARRDPPAESGNECLVAVGALQHRSSRLRAARPARQAPATSRPCDGTRAHRPWRCPCGSPCRRASPRCAWANRASRKRPPRRSDSRR